MQSHKGRENKLCQNTERQKCQEKKKMIIRREGKKKRESSEEMTPVSRPCLDLTEGERLGQPRSASLCNVKGSVGRPVTEAKG